MENLLCIGGVFDGQRKKCNSKQLWHRFVTSSKNLDEQCVGVEDAVGASITMSYEEYRVSQLRADGLYMEFLIVRGLTDGAAFQILFNSYESVRQAYNAPKEIA